MSLCYGHTLLENSFFHLLNINGVILFILLFFLMTHPFEEIIIFVYCLFFSNLLIHFVNDSNEIDSVLFVIYFHNAFNNKRRCWEKRDHSLNMIPFDIKIKDFNFSISTLICFCFLKKNLQFIQKINLMEMKCLFN